jgi:hypothetical protein
MAHERQAAERLVQVPWTQLGGSASPLDGGGESDILLRRHPCFLVAADGYIKASYPTGINIRSRISLNQIEKTDDRMEERRLTSIPC